MVDPVYRYLQRFVEVSQEEYAFILKLVEVRHFNKKMRLVALGEQERYLNFIANGLVRKFFYRRKEEINTQIAREGQLICSSVSFMSGAPSDYVVETIEPTTVVSISRQNLDQLYELSPKMERMGRLVITDWLIQKENWENARIKQTPKERFLKFNREHPDLVERVPQKLLASYLSIKPETFSRYKHILVQETADI